MSAQDDDLEQLGIYLSWVPPDHARAAREHFKRVESRLAHLEEGLRRIRAWDCLNPPRPDLLADLPWLAAEIDALLADQDGAAQPKVYPANDWEHITADCVACPGCAFTFDAFHVTQATGQYDCPVCGAQSRDGAA